MENVGNGFLLGVVRTGRNHSVQVLVERPMTTVMCFSGLPVQKLGVCFCHSVCQSHEQRCIQVVRTPYVSSSRLCVITESFFLGSTSRQSHFKKEKNNRLAPLKAAPRISLGVFGMFWVGVGERWDYGFSFGFKLAVCCE